MTIVERAAKLETVDYDLLIFFSRMNDMALRAGTSARAFSGVENVRGCV